MTNNNIMNKSLRTEKSVKKLAVVSTISHFLGSIKGWFNIKGDSMPRTTPNPQEVHTMMQNGNWMLLNALTHDGRSNSKRHR